MPKSSSMPLSAMDRALKILATAPISEAELRRKLRQKGYPDLLIDPVIADCRKRGYLNDELLAQDSLAYMRQRGSGSRLVQLKLQRRGLAPALIKAVLDAENPECDLETCRQALLEKLRSLKRESDWRKRRGKAFRFLTARGFKSDSICAALSEIDWHAENADDASDER